MKEKATSLTRWSASLLLLAAGLANAAPVPSDLSIQASVKFDTEVAVPVTGNVTQFAAINLVGGGVVQSASFTDDPAAMAPATSFAGTLTETGDGLFATARMSGSGVNPGPVPVLGIDFTLDLANGSATDSFEVFLRFGRLHSVSATGPDAYASSEFIVVDSALTELFVTDYEVDTLFLVNELVDEGGTSFRVVLAPGATFSLSADLTQEGYPYDGEFSADLIVDIELERIAVLGDPPQPVPLPGTLPLLGLGLALLATRRRRTAYQPRR